MKARLISRRGFLTRSGLASGSLLILKSLHSLRAAPASERLNVAIIGVGGRGRWFVDTMPKLANVVALCDVNEQRAGNAFEVIPQARKFHDFRRMLEQMDREIDGVIVATPDHTHAVATALAIKMGKHVYCEKPLTRNLAEARHLRELAARSKRATQLGNQGTASEAFRRAVELVQAGAIGDVREAHAWNDSGGAGARPIPTQRQDVPDSLKWDLWLGPAPERPFHRDWLNWHAWRDFGTGQLGNWAVHTMNLAFKALKLDWLWQANGGSDRRVRIHAEVSSVHPETFPKWEIVRFDFPARGGLPPVRINWYNGSRGPNVRKTIEDLMGRALDWGDAGEKKWNDFAGVLLVGSKGKIHANGHNTVFTLGPNPEAAVGVPRSFPRSPGHEREWLNACQGGPAAVSNFNYGGPLTEFVLLGNAATLHPGELVFDCSTGQFVDNAEANRALSREYREGWNL
ncbi:MAG: Gfo/Idh/MocA family oxidoreductase [Verrucomicrobia bacterium]|nr:Gfo/Idh/MocA family oxidoreductase [Verrucomicrobiota bacterium]